MLEELKNDNQSLLKSMVNGLGVLMSVFGATILVPSILGINSSPVLFALGIGSILSLVITGFKVPYFLSSSFAFIAASIWSIREFGISVTSGSIIMSGIPYLLLALLIKILGDKFIKRVFSPVVLGCTVLSIATSLMPVAISSATTLNNQYSLMAILISVLIISIILVFNFFIKLPSISVLIGLVFGYIICYILGLVKFNYQPFFINPLQNWQLPHFNPSSFIPFMILSISTMAEHLSDISAIGSVTGKDYYKDPGIHRTLISDGLGNMISGFFGNPVSSTSYGENTAWCAISKEYSTKNQLFAGFYLFLLSFLGLFNSFLGSIPQVVIGAVSLFLYGMIGAAGLNLLIKNQIDLNKTRNLVICSLVLSISIGGFVLKIGNFQLSSIACGTIIGILLNLILPTTLQKKEIIS